MTQEKFYITTAIPYMNAKLHLGQIYEFIIADVVASVCVARVNQSGLANSIQGIGPPLTGGARWAKCGRKNGKTTICRPIAHGGQIHLTTFAAYRAPYRLGQSPRQLLAKDCRSPGATSLI